MNLTHWQTSITVLNFHLPVNFDMLHTTLLKKGGGSGITELCSIVVRICRGATIFTQLLWRHVTSWHSRATTARRFFIYVIYNDAVKLHDDGTPIRISVPILKFSFGSPSFSSFLTKNIFWRAYFRHRHLRLGTTDLDQNTAQVERFIWCSCSFFVLAFVQFDF